MSRRTAAAGQGAARDNDGRLPQCRRWRNATLLRYDSAFCALAALNSAFRGAMYDRRPDFFREDTPPGRRVEATVKWFNASKGFGFVTLSDGSQDAFLPMA